MIVITLLLTSHLSTLNPQQYIGTEIYVYGTTDNTRGPNAVSVGFELDERNRQEFDSVDGSPAILHNLMFQAKGLKNKNHTLKITSLNETPWFLDYVVYKTTNSSAIIDNSPDKGKSNTGAIVGGVVSAIAILGILVFLAFFLIRRRRKARGDHRFSKTIHEINDHSINGNIGSDPRGDGRTGFSPTPYMIERPYDSISPSKDSKAALAHHGHAS